MAVNSPIRIFGGDPTPQSVTLNALFGFVSADRIASSACRYRDRLHCFNAIHHQVDDHLLQFWTLSPGSWVEPV